MFLWLPATKIQRRVCLKLELVVLLLVILPHLFFYGRTYTRWQFGFSYKSSHPLPYDTCILLLIHPVLTEGISQKESPFTAATYLLSWDRLLSASLNISTNLGLLLSLLERSLICRLGTQGSCTSSSLSNSAWSDPSRISLAESYWYQLRRIMWDNKETHVKQ